MPATAQKKAVQKPAVRVSSRIEFDSETADVTIRKLKLAAALKKGGVEVEIEQVLTGGQFEDTMTGAPQLTLDLLDRNFHLLNSGVFDATVDVELDGIPFRLAEVSVTDRDVLELLFEHKIVALLRKHTSALKAARSSTTRAQFFEIMLREIAADMPGLTFICPEENVVQPIGAAKASGRTLTAKKISSGTKQPAARTATAAAASTGSSGGTGFSVSSITIRTWDGGTVTLGPSQLAVAATILETCAQDHAPAKAVLAIMEAASVEPDTPYGNPGTPGDHSSTGTFQLLPSTAASTGLNPLDVAACAHAFLTRGFGAAAGGAIGMANSQPGMSAGQIAQSVEGSAFPSRYDAAGAGAQTVISAWHGAAGGTLLSGLTGAAAGGTVTKSTVYEFTRGQSGQKEDSWTCMQRLAQEVQWRVFVAGRRNIYFVTDDDLLKNAPKYVIEPDTPGAGTVTFHAEVGGRSIIRHGIRIPKPSEAQLTPRIGRWDAPPGEIIELAGYGRGDGSWIVADTIRPLFDRSAQVTLNKPQTPLPEPAATTTVSSGSSVSVKSPGGVIIPGGSSSSQNPIDRVYAAAAWIDHRNLPYVWGGGHTGDWQSAVRANGYDCSSSTSVALFLAGLMSGFSAPIVSGDFGRWGAPGIGSQMTVWWTAGHVYIEFVGRPAKQFNTVPGGGPHLRFYAASSDAGRNPVHWPGF